MQDLLSNYQRIRNQTEKLCAPLEIEDYIPQVSIFVSPPKWNLGHTSWFFEEMILKNHLPNYPIFDSKFSFLFNSYYNNVGERTLRQHRGLITRPSVKKVYEYRDHVDKFMEKLLSKPIYDAVKYLVVLGLNHEQQHQELFITDLKYTFSFNPIHPVYDLNQDFTNVENSASGWLKIDEGIYEIGHQDDDFCFDNELGLHKVFLHKFEIAENLVTNAEYIEFIEARVYSDFRFWLEEAWAWVNQNKISAPLYWQKIDGKWFHYTLAGLKAVNPNAILSHISFYEASAFAAWKNMRLASEFEWEIASKHLDWGKRWEWTNSAYLPYPNFKIADGAVGEYNGKFMVNQMVLRGASTATPENHSRHTYRNFFHPNAQWQFSGIRLVK